MRESYSLAQLANNNLEQTTNSFSAVRRFVLDKSSSGGQDFSTLFRNARDELKKFNDGLIGNQNKKSSEDNKE
jgi:hypothetical protein